jgi:hypothetical protein
VKDLEKDLGVALSSMAVCIELKERAYEPIPAVTAEAEARPLSELAPVAGNADHTDCVLCRVSAASDTGPIAASSFGLDQFFNL